MKWTQPRHRRPNSREFQTALSLMEALRRAGCLVPTPPLHRMEMDVIDMIAVGMGTVRREDIAAQPAPDADLASFGDA